MNKHISWVLTLFFTVGISLPAKAFQVSGDSIYALFIGNSYTYYNQMPEMVKAIAHSDGKPLSVKMIAPGGWTLAKHLKSPETVNTIKERAWDFVILQEQSQAPAAEKEKVLRTMYPTAQSLDSIRRISSPKGKTVFYLTWGHRTDDYDAMQRRLIANYKDLSQRLNALYAPVGMAWKKVRDENDKVNLYNPDNSHPSPAGSYLAANVFYSTLFQQPYSSSYDGGLPQEEAEYLQQVAQQAVFTEQVDRRLYPAPKLLVRGDDMGSSHAANIASIDVYKRGIETSIELMAVTPWFPEAVRMLKENTGVEVGLHLTITSEWENMKWRPLTNCPSLVDENGYFFPMISPNKDYPGQSILENKWKPEEIEQEFRAQIKLAMRNVPQINHLSGHMGSMRFAPGVSELVNKLAKEYNLIVIDRQAEAPHNVQFVGYQGPNKTYEEKEKSFINMLNGLQPGGKYLFVDHPALDTDEMGGIGHIGYEWVAQDRQGVTDLFKSRKVKSVIDEKGIELVTHSDLVKSLPRAQSGKALSKAVDNYWKAVKTADQDIHSLMVLQHGKVVSERWDSDGAPGKPHILNSVSKTFTATAIGFAVSEGKLKVTDKVISFFPDDLPATIPDNFKELEVCHLLTMSVGQDVDIDRSKLFTPSSNWIRDFFSVPILQKPGTQFAYNSMATFMLSAIIQKVSGEKLINYLYPRLFRPLGITGATWICNGQDINVGGWGLYVKTEDMAKLGQLFLQKGEWDGQQLLPAAWIEEATSMQIASLPAHVTEEQVKERKMSKKESDWLQGYGYQMWRCRYNAIRADGANGQFIILLPEKDAVVVLTANVSDMQAEINLIWEYILPAL